MIQIPVLDLHQLACSNLNLLADIGKENLVPSDGQ